jgi:hypothetical protein
VALEGLIIHQHTLLELVRVCKGFINFADVYVFVIERIRGVGVCNTTGREEDTEEAKSGVAANFVKAI